MAKLSQNQRVLNHLIDHGYITQTIASSYGIRRLASRVFDLTTRGIEVTVESRTDDAGVRYAYYSLSDSARAEEHVSRANGGTWMAYVLPLYVVKAA